MLDNEKFIRKLYTYGEGDQIRAVQFCDVST
jgi:hypothetical protein